MSTRAIVGIISFCIAMTGIFLGNLIQTMMIGEINRKRQDGNLVFLPRLHVPENSEDIPRVSPIISEWLSSHMRIRRNGSRHYQDDWCGDCISRHRLNRVWAGGRLLRCLH
jgi:hypothetical protein